MKRGVTTQGSKFVCMLGMLSLSAAMMGCHKTEGACLFLKMCSVGSSYEGNDGQELCLANGGTWAEDGCPTNDCLGICDCGTYSVYYYKQYGVAAAKDQCDFEGGTWTSGCGGGYQPPDWFTSSCEELGGTTTATGACFVDCTPSGDCSIEGLSCGFGGQQFCRISSCTSDSDCGPTGWYCEYSWCYLVCSSDSGGAQSPECPEGFKCLAGTGKAPSCVRGIDTNPTCGEPCPQGCCSPSGLTCCSPPYCSGDCSGSPCC